MKKFCPICHGACLSDHIERHVDHPLVTRLKAEMAIGKWSYRRMGEAINRDPTAVSYILKGHGFSPKIDILEAMLAQVGIMIRWAKLLNWEPSHRIHVTPSGRVGIQTKPYTKMRKHKPHPMILQLKERRLELALTMHDIEVAVDISASEISDMETGCIGNPHITTAQAYAQAVGLRLVYREV